MKIRFLIIIVFVILLVVSLMVVSNWEQIQEEIWYVTGEYNRDSDIPTITWDYPWMYMGVLVTFLIIGTIIIGSIIFGSIILLFRERKMKPRYKILIVGIIIISTIWFLQSPSFFGQPECLDLIIIRGDGYTSREGDCRNLNNLERIHQICCDESKYLPSIDGKVTDSLTILNAERDAKLDAGYKLYPGVGWVALTDQNIVEPIYREHPETGEKVLDLDAIIKMIESEPTDPVPIPEPRQLHLGYFSCSSDTTYKDGVCFVNP